jgi:4-amino-4-deoxy-L-arabinose transferase-like glycosyltransferase
MNGLCVILLVITLSFLVWGLISPVHLASKAKISKRLTRKHTGLGFGGLAIALILLVGITAPKTIKVNSVTAAAHVQAPDSHNQQLIKPSIVTKQVTEQQPISYTTINENDTSLPSGKTVISQAGQNGTKTLTYNEIFKNGQQTSKNLISTDITTQPVNEIVENGTYVAPAPTAPVAVAPTPASTPSSSSSTSSQNCTPISNEGTCYEPGEYCRGSDEGDSGIAGDGESIICEDNDGLRWEPN